MLDSLAIEFLIGWLEEQFEISFGYRDVVAEHFASVGVLAAFVDAKRPGATGQSART
jgi:acyl carrier protein